MAARTRHAGIALTGRGWTLAGASAALVVASRVLGSEALAGLGIAGGLLLVAAAAATSTRRPALELTRGLEPARVHVGGEGRVIVHGTAAAATPLLTVTEPLDAGRREARFVVSPLPAGTPVRVSYRVPTHRRGVHEVGPMELTVSDPLGLAARSWVAADSAHIVVCPRVHDVLPPRRGGGGEPAERSEGPRVLVESLGELLGLRDYEPGDDPRRVHWRSSARRGDLVTRVDEAAAPGGTAVLLDTRAGVHDHESFELAVEVVASVSASLDRFHRPVEVLTAAGTILRGPRRGGSAPERAVLLDELAVAEPSEDDRLAAVVGVMRNRLDLGAVVAVTGAPDTKIVDALARLWTRRAVTLVTTRRGGVTAGRLPTVDASIEPFPSAWNRACLQWRAASFRSPSASPR